MIGRRALFSVVGATAVVAATLLGGSTASAQMSLADGGVDTRGYQDTDYAGSNGTWVEVCDRERDGNGVYGQFSTNTGTHTVRDGNGSSGGCGNATYGAVHSFRVCEDLWARPDSCSRWATP